MKKLLSFFACLAVCALWSPASVVAAEPDGEGWVSLFDGKTLNGWKVNEVPEAWKVVDGTIVVNGPRSHLFYVGDEQPFVNFEFKAEVKANPNSNSGIYIHTKFQPDGWPKYGFETQVNNSYNSDPRKTGSLYGVVDVKEQNVEDNTWWTQHIIVKGKQVIIKINEKEVVNYTEPDNQKAFDGSFERRLGSGTFALQGHDPGSTVTYRNIRVKRLP